MNTKSLQVAAAALLTMGVVSIPAEEAAAQGLPACHAEVSKESPDPRQEDDCDEVGNPYEGGSDHGSGSWWSHDPDARRTEELQPPTT